MRGTWGVVAGLALALGLVVLAALSGCAGDGDGREGDAGSVSMGAGEQLVGVYDVEWDSVGLTAYEPDFLRCDRMLVGYELETSALRLGFAEGRNLCGESEPASLEGGCVCSAGRHAYDGPSEDFCACPVGDYLEAEIRWTAPDGPAVTVLRAYPGPQ